MDPNLKKGYEVLETVRPKTMELYQQLTDASNL